MLYQNIQGLLHASAREHLRIMNSSAALKALLEVNPKSHTLISHQAGQPHLHHTDLWVQPIPIVGCLCLTWVLTIQDVLMMVPIHPDNYPVELQIPSGLRQTVLQLKYQQMELIEVISTSFQQQFEEAHQRLSTLTSLSIFRRILLLLGK